MVPFYSTSSKKCAYCWKRSQMKDIFIKIQYLECFVSFPSYLYQIIKCLSRIFRAKILFLAFDRLISDYTQIYSLIMLCIRNVPQNIFDLSPTPGFLLNRLRNFTKISVTTPESPNKITHVSPTTEQSQFSFTLNLIKSV